MGTSHTSSLAAAVRHISAVWRDDTRTDGELLGRFATHRDESAFVALVGRHGRVVWAVCRTGCVDVTDAEDAFQATFMALAHKAPALADRDRIEPWLRVTAGYAVRKLKRSAARFARLRRRAAARPQPDAPPGAVCAPAPCGEDVEGELRLIPPDLETAFRLYHIEGRTFAQVAESLNCSLATAQRRVVAARELLRNRLAARGLAAPAVLGAVVANAAPAPAAVPEPLLLQAAAAAFAHSPLPGTVAGALAQHLVAPTVGLRWYAVLAAVCLVGGTVAALSLPPRTEPRPAPAPVASRENPGQPHRAPALATLVGQVRDEAGHPVPYARVNVLARHRDRGEGGAGDRSLGAARADGTGRYTLPVPPFQTPVPDDRRVKLLASGPNGSTLAVREVLLPPGADSGTFDLVVLSGPECRGRVTDLRGEPVSGAKVSVIGLGDVTVSHTVGLPCPEPTPDWPGAVRTDAAGCFQIPGTNSVAVKLAIEHDAHAYTEVRVPARPAPRQAEPALVRLGPARRLEGRVLAADTGEPVPLARVVVSGVRMEGSVGRNVRADIEGRFAVNLTDDREVRVQAHGPDDGPYLSVLHALDWPTNPTDAKREMKLVLPRGVLVRGRVIEEGTGAPVAGAQVQFAPRRHGNAHHRPEVLLGGAAVCATGADGRYAIPVLPGPGVLMVSGPSLGYVPRETDVGTLDSGQSGGRRLYPHAIEPLNTSPSEPPREQVSVLRRGTAIEGRAVSPDGRPVPSGWVTCRHLVTARDLSSPVTVPVLDGRFRVPGCEPGRRYFAVVADTENRWATVVELGLPERPGETAEVKLEPVGRAELRFVLRDGSPVAGASPNLVLMLPPDVPANDPGARASRLRLADPVPVRWPSAPGGIGPVSNPDGHLVLPALFPGARYRIGTLAGAVWRPVVELQPKAGETLQLHSVVVGDGP